MTAGPSLAVTGSTGHLTAGTGTFHNETVEEACTSRAPYGAPPWQVDAWVSTYTAGGCRAGPVLTASGLRRRPEDRRHRSKTGLVRSRIAVPCQSRCPDTRPS